MEQKYCKNCLYFRQHYALDQHKLFRVHCGHCTHSRPRRRLPDSKACEHYMCTPSREDAFVTKEYLSKSLLEYISQLELLPEICDMGCSSKKQDKTSD